VNTSLLEIFKIGIGPSSSHTVGPMRAALAFVETLKNKGLLGRVRRVQTDLYGSLALTGRGHATDRAVLLGLSGELPDQVDPVKTGPLVNGIRTARSLLLGGIHPIAFDESLDLLFHKDSTLPAHPNGMSFRAFEEQGIQFSKEVYYSVGGGVIKTEAEMQRAQPDTDSKKAPYAFKSAADLLRIGEEEQLAIWQIILENEKSRRSETDIRAFVDFGTPCMRA